MIARRTVGFRAVFGNIPGVQPPVRASSTSPGSWLPPRPEGGRREKLKTRKYQKVLIVKLAYR